MDEEYVNDFGRDEGETRDRSWTPCDYADENGNHYCPYADTYTGYEDEMCRNCCGLGVDD